MTKNNKNLKNVNSVATVIPKAHVKKTGKAFAVNKYKNYIMAAVLVFTVLLYRGSLQNEFVAGDDYILVVENKDIRSFSNVPNFFTQPYHSMYCPVKMISHTIDYAFSGAKPSGYHFFSLLYHLVNVALVFTFIFILLQNAWGAGIAAMLFAVHPINVETVDWLTGRGDLLYCGFYLGGLIAYIYYLTKGYRAKYLAISFLMFALSGLSKASAFTFPLALVVLDWYYRRKLLSWRVALEKAPFFIGSLALGLSSIALRSGHSVELSDYLTHFSGVDNFMILIYPLTFYLAKFFVPLKLALPYPHPFASDPPVLSWDFYLYPLILIVLALIIWRCKSVRRPLSFAVLLYFAALVSALRLTPMLGTIAADRYFYVSMIAVTFFIGWAFTYMYEQKRKNFRIYKAFICTLVCFLLIISVATHERIKVFKNGITLFGDAHNKYPHHATPLYELTGGYMQAGDMENALKTSEKIVALLPKRIDPLGFRFNILMSTNRLDEALPTIRRIVELKQQEINEIDTSKMSATHRISALKQLAEFCMAKVSTHQRLNQKDSTLVMLNQIINLQPDSAMYISSMIMKANVCNDMGLFPEAFTAANTLLARYPDAHSMLMARAFALFNTGRLEEAIDDLNMLIKHEPENITAYLNIGKICFQLGRITEACSYWQKAKEYGNQEAEELLKNCKSS